MRNARVSRTVKPEVAKRKDFVLTLVHAFRFTMLGDSNGENPVRGIFPLAVLDLFESLRAREHSGESPRVVASFYEIYCGKLYDLLNSRKHLHARENAHGKVVLQGVRELESTTAEELMSQVAVGLAARTTGVTGANVDSSRSHAIIEISLKRPATNGRLVSSGAKLSFIDLAGSERGADTVEQDKQTRMDGAEINKSLLALKECIRALDQQLDHTPFRGSKLTQVLKDSFVGANCMTLMIANISPSSASVEHTLNTLRYAYRVRELRGAVATRRYLPAATMEPPELVTTDSCNSSSSSSSCSEGEKISSPAPLRNGGVSLSPLSLSKDNLAREHDRLIGVILAEEEELISAHRKSLETFVHMLNEEMAQVNRIDQPGSDVDQYVAYMDGNLAEKERLVSGMRARLAKFKQHLQDEELLSRAFK